jgi:hypothetical protein
MNKSLTLKIILLLTFFSHGIIRPKNKVQERESNDFISSFIDNYGFSPNARDAHEYHSFILDKTRQSFNDLENHLQKNGFDLKGRMVICGYQEDAISNYYTSSTQEIIDDEVSKKTNVGWQFSQGNLFGFATGFVLKDVNAIKKYTRNQQFGFEHIADHKIGLFDDHAHIFHKHAFGSAYNLLMHTRKQIIKALLSNSPKLVLKLLRELWKNVYARDLRNESGTLIATQDILFSIYYARYLIDSTLPLLHFFVGPDITYPIEVLPCQKVGATHGAQQFLQRCVHTLRPIDNQKTAYIFCSFVDGVGKSTLLGNIKNYIRFGADYHKYERVDNSSSQYATLFNLNDDVVIADLPAQASHFIPKPDGSVYVDIATIKELGSLQIQDIQKYAQENFPTLKANFTQKLHEIRDLKKRGKLCMQEYDAPSLLYVKNCVILNLKYVHWIPFEYHNKHFVCKADDPFQVRILTPFEGVHSYGLKVSNPELMIFHKGLSLPSSQDAFLAHLSEQLHQRGVQNVVFVDFISMYPRTSRENIRVNFLLQQLSHIFGADFDLQHSLYKGFVNPQELYVLLKKGKQKVFNALMQEAGLRFALFTLLQECPHEGKTQISLSEIPGLLHDTYKKLHEQHRKHMHSVIQQKIMRECADVLKAYEFDRDFQTIVRFDFEPVIALSKYIQELFTMRVHDSYLNHLWSGMHAIKTDSKKIFFADGSRAQILYTFDPQCRDKMALKECLGVIRAHWYATLSNLLLVSPENSDYWQVQRTAHHVPPLMVLSDEHGMIQVVRKYMSPITDMQEIQYFKPPQPFFTQEHATKLLPWGSYGSEVHCLDWTQIHTGIGLYAFGYDPTDEKNPITSIVDQHKHLSEHQERKNAIFISTAELTRSIKYQNLWHKLYRGCTHYKIPEPLSACLLEAVRLFIRAIATLDMIIKDSDAHIITRKGNKEDFAAALQLLEKITLPNYFGLTFKKPLFDNYQAVEPVISWD